MTLTYPFSQADAEAAQEAWGCNCGPSALAFALQVGLDVVRPAIPEFDRKRYTSPSMMRAALDFLRRRIVGVQYPSVAAMFDSTVSVALVRIQWTGPWTAPGVNPKWAYRMTHWVATWRDGERRMVFDVNGGIRDFDSWQSVIVPILVGLYPRADGGWRPTHIWRLQ